MRGEIRRHNITSIRSGAHTLKLCVNDVIGKSEMKKKLQKLRSVATKLRSPKYRSILKNGGYPRPILDCETRWNSTFDMLERQFLNFILLTFL